MEIKTDKTKKVLVNIGIIITVVLKRFYFIYNVMTKPRELLRIVLSCLGKYHIYQDTLHGREKDNLQYRMGRVKSCPLDFENVRYLPRHVR